MMEKIKRNWKGILVVLIIILLEFLLVKSFISSGYEARIADIEKVIGEHERNRERCEEVLGWYKMYLTDCEIRAGDYYDTLKAYNIPLSQ